MYLENNLSDTAQTVALKQILKATAKAVESQACLFQGGV